MKRLLILMSLLCVFHISADTTREIEKKINNFSNLSEDQKIQLIKDVIKREPFLKESADIKYKPHTVGKFFNNKIYSRLKGNDILGYIYDQGFFSNTKDITIKTLKLIGDTKKYKNDFINTLKYVAKKMNVRFVKNSHIKLGIALLQVQEEKTKNSYPGALVEFYFVNESSGKKFFQRLGTGKKNGHKSAMADLWTLALNTLSAE